MMKKTKIRNRLNWRIISGDLKEAREQIEQIEKSIQTKTYPAEVEFQLMLEHAYHHLNIAWNTRRVKTEAYAKMTEADFNKWSQIPKEIQIYKLQKTRKKKNS